MAERILFNKGNLGKVRPTDRARRIYDTRTPGLAARVSPKGLVTFILYRKSAGRVEQVTLGRFPAMTPELARKRVDALNGEIANGASPSAQKRNRAAEETFGDLFDRYLEDHAKAHKKTWEQDQTAFKRHLSRWARRPLPEIDQSTVRRLHANIGKTSGPYEANRLLALVRTVFNRAIAWGWKGENPAQHIKAFREQSRDRFLSADELPRLFAALREEHNQTARDFILLCLMTGARRGNVLAMRWEQLDIDSGLWRIPDTKNGTALTVPLVTEAVAVLREREAEAEVAAGECEDNSEQAREWVFPGRGKSGHLQEPRKAWERICARAQIKNLRIHDLRRTMGSWQAGTGANLSVIGRSLGHKSIATTQIYARLDLDPVRIAMETAARAMLATDK